MMFMCTKEEESSTKIKLSLMEQVALKPERDNGRSSTPGVLQIIPLTFANAEPTHPILPSNDHPSSPPSPKSHNEYTVRHFFRAIYEARLTDVRHALHYVDVRSRDRDGKTTLMAAVLANPEHRRLPLLRLLISSGADLTATDRVHGRDVIGWAALAGRHSPLAFLFDLLDGEVDFHFADNDGAIYLHLAVSSGELATVQCVLDWMLRLQIAVDIPNRLGLTPYIMARRLGHTHIAELLRVHGEASPLKYDEVTFRSPREWSMVGRRERNRKMRPLQLQMKRLPHIEEADTTAKKSTPSSNSNSDSSRQSVSPVRSPPELPKLKNGAVHPIRLDRVFALWSEQKLPSWRTPSHPRKGDPAPIGRAKHARHHSRRLRNHR